MKILLLSRYSFLGASSRVRYGQYLPYFISHGFEVDTAPLFSDAYLRALYAKRGRIRHVLSGYIRRLRDLLRVRSYDIAIVEKELFPFAPAAAERLLRWEGVPYVADYDDALFHKYDQHRMRIVRLVLGKKIDIVMHHASLVVAGNEYLAKRARNAGARRVETIPTVIDLDRYPPTTLKLRKCDQPMIIGWIGTPKTSRYLQPLNQVFECLSKKYNVRFVAVGASRESLGDLMVEPWPWTEETEVESVRRFDVGIMPLEDSPWERGKCGYKLIQYMACGLPVVASPVGANREIVKVDENGFLATTPEQWEKYLEKLIFMSAEKRTQLGAAGRRDVEAWYSLKIQAPRLLKALMESRY